MTKKRKASVFLDKVETVYQRRHHLEEAFEKLIANTYELGEKDFDPTTPPGDIANHMERDITTLTTMAEHTLTIYEEQIVEAEKVMSLQVTDLAPPPSKEQPAPSSTQFLSSSIPMFRPQ